jgi:pyrimidine-specific ribonucleoside hydrolase
MARKILIDTDPGIDDSVAILMALACRDLEVMGITTVAGNVGIEAVTRNALSLVALAGKRVPVSSGSADPLVVKRISASSVHGEDGVGGARLPPPAFARDPRPAESFIRDIAADCGGDLELVTLGPLTNVAKALLAYPALRKGGIRRIYMMGGSAGFGNATSAAEFNIIADPHAAACVFQAGIPITMCGLDVTNNAELGKAEIAGLRDGGGKVAGLCCDMLEFYLESYKSFGRKTLALHDPVALSALIRPSIVTTKACRVDVETDGEYTTGKTVVDVLGVTGLAPNADVALKIDVDAFLELVLGLIRSYD